MYFQSEKKTNNRAVIYCRVSSEEQVKGYSLTIQEKLCREFVASHGFELAEVFIEKGESAKTLDRTELTRMWDFVSKKQNDIQFIVAYKVDRIARNRHDYRELDMKRVKNGLKFRYVTEQFDDSPAGRFMEDMFANMAHFDNDVRTERSMGGMREAMRQGRYVWRAPIGYVNAIVDRRANIVQTKYAPLILQAFNEIETGHYSTDQVRVRMAKLGLVTNRGKPIAQSHFYSLVRNKIYAGWIEKFGEIHKGSFTPIVSQSLFDTVQLRLSGRKNKITVYKKENPDFPLRRFVRSADGKYLRGYWAKGRSKKYPFYSFCEKNTTISRELLENKFKALLNSFEFDYEYLSVLRENIIYHFDTQNKSDMKSSLAIDVQIEDLYAQMRHYSENEFKGIIDSKLLEIHISDLTLQLRELEKKKEQIQSEESLNVRELLEFAKDFLENPSKVWATNEYSIKIRFQWFVFPDAVILENKKLRTANLCKLFKLKKDITHAISCIVHNTGTEIKPVSKTNSPSSKEILFQTKDFWRDVLGELEELSQIVNCPTAESDPPASGSS